MMITAPVNVSSSGGNTIVSGIAGRKIRVFAWQLTFNGTVNATWQSSTGSVALTGPVYGVAGGGANNPPLVAPSPQPIPQFVAAVGDDLTLNLSGAIAVGGYVVYDLVQGSM